MINNHFKDIIDKLNLPKTHKHIFLCVPETEKCCSITKAMESWDYLKFRTKELQEKNIIIQRSKASCLRICKEGPIMVIYPDGVWYHSCTTSNIERILNEHILGGKVVQDLLIFSQ